MTKPRFQPRDIVRVKSRPENPTEVICVSPLKPSASSIDRDPDAPRHVLFLMDKRTLMVEFRYDNDVELELVRRPSAAATVRPGVGDISSGGDRDLRGQRRPK